jgi:tol-pal system protein YbgF
VTAAGLGAAPVAVTLPQGPPKQQYDYAFDFLKRQDYARAEAALREFLKRNPKDPLAGNAQYWLGESLYVRGDYQAAAVEFMNGYTNYPKSNKGPDNLLKLGLAMANLNQNQGACTALSRIPREYPDAPENVRKAAQAERVKLKCA